MINQNKMTAVEFDEQEMNNRIERINEVERLKWANFKQSKKMEKMTHTAVEFLKRQYNFNKQLFLSDFIQAKAIEEEQIVNAWDNSTHSGDYRTGKEYYDETFKSE